MTAYYNEIDPFAAEWLRNLIKAGHIAPGEVDERSIADVAADDLRPYTQCHFFAGIGVWSHAARLAGWSDDRPVWTGSCPCQPFSVAGKGAGQDDERHLWPVWFKLIEQCRPPVVFGEQVEAAIRHGWLDLVQGDLEGIGYASGAVCIPAGSVGAPHIRQRLWFVAHNQHTGLQGGLSGRSDTRRENQHGHLGCDSAVGIMAHSRACGRQDESPHTRGSAALFGAGTAAEFATDSGDSAFDRMADSFKSNHRRQAESANHRQSQTIGPANRVSGCGGSFGESRSTVPTDHFWRDADWLFCRDGKWRPVEPGTFPLAHGATARVGRLRAYGNAICPQVAQEVISAFMECCP